MIIRRATDADRDAVARLMAEFRAALREFAGGSAPPDVAAAREELASYGGDRFTMWVADDGAEVIGYLLCRTDGSTVWAEHLFVAPDHRRRGVGTALYVEAEALARRRGGRTVFNWVHPNNDAVIAFLGRLGYGVLNLVELRKAVPGDADGRTIRVGDHKFRY